MNLFLSFLLVYEQKYPPSATTLHFEFYAEPGPEVKVERKVKAKTFKQSYSNTNHAFVLLFCQLSFFLFCSKFVFTQQTSSNTLHYIHIEQLDKVQS